MGSLRASPVGGPQQRGRGHSGLEAPIQGFPPVGLLPAGLQRPLVWSKLPFYKSFGFLLMSQDLYLQESKNDPTLTTCPLPVGGRRLLPLAPCVAASL